jgi:DHA1 family multidrug resistance protein-like MFS transporter
MPVETENNRSFYAACVTGFLLRIEWGVATGFLPVHVYELGGSPVEVALVFSVFAAIMVFSSLFWGGFSDSVGRRKIFIVIGMLGLLPIYLLIAFQEDVLTIILLRGSTALLKGAVVPCTWALVSELSSSDAVGRNMGILSAAELAGFAVGPIFGGLMAQFFGFLVLWFSIAAICFAGGLIFLIAGADSAKLVRREGTIPLLDTVRKKEVISKILIISISSAFILFGYSFLGPNLNVYLVGDLGYSKALVGVFSFIGMGITALTQPFLGHFSDKYGRKPVMILSAFSLALGNLVLLLGRDVYWVILAQILINYYSSFNTVASAHISDGVTSGERSGALGILNSLSSFARSAASVAGGLVISATDIPTALKIAAVFPMLAILMVVFAVKEGGYSYDMRHGGKS